MEYVDFLTKWNADILALANVVLAIATIVLAIGIPYTIRGASKEERERFYATLDNIYLEIKKMVIEHPHIADSDATTKSADQVVQYDAYAFIVWNFIETIYDYSGQKDVRETWECIVRYEAREHAAWFNDPKNQVKFKDRFVKYVNEHGLCKAQ